MRRMLGNLASACAVKALAAFPAFNHIFIRRILLEGFPFIATFYMIDVLAFAVDHVRKVRELSGVVEAARNRVDEFVHHDILDFLQAERADITGNGDGINGGMTVMPHLLTAAPEGARTAVQTKVAYIRIIGKGQSSGLMFDFGKKLCGIQTGHGAISFLC